MRKENLKLTTSQFARLHGVNNRTLHYYDSIGLFSPNTKGDNKYRYYETRQSMDFEYIRMLKELNMSIEEIRNYLSNPNPHNFIEIADYKTDEIERQIQKLNRTKEVLRTMKKQVELCENLKPQEICIKKCEEERFLVTPYPFADDDLHDLFSHVKNVWGIEQCRMGIGSYISVEKVTDDNFEQYDGLFTPASISAAGPDVCIKPKGTYLCGYQKGTWDKLPDMYRKMKAFSREHHMKLTGFAYEIGLNDFVITDSEDYVTQIMIKTEIS